MKRFIKGIASRLGYTISRDDSNSFRKNPFTQMQAILRSVEKPVIFDVGAHHGETAKTFRNYFPAAYIYSFEPFPQSYSVLRESMGEDPWFYAFPYGLAAVEGHRVFHSNSKSVTNSLLPSDPRGAQVWGCNLLDTVETCHVDVKTIDSMIAQIGIRGIDILKLDVQGAEYEVLAGATLACREKRIRMIYTEIITQPTYIGQLRFDEALKAFYGAGFDLHYVYNLTSSKSGKLCQVDALFTSDEPSEGLRQG